MQARRHSPASIVRARPNGSLRRRGFVFGTAATLLAQASLAAFKDPLELPARHSPLAALERMTGIARAGSRLVAVGRLGRIVYSDDGGANWVQADVPVSSDLTSVHFPVPGRGWAVGHDGVILLSTDSGVSWTRQLDGRQIGPQAVDHFRQRASEGDTEARTALEAAKQLASDGADKPFLDVWFADELKGFAVGAFNLALHTVDGGRNWISIMDRMENPKAQHLYSISRGTDETYIAGEQGLLRRWNRATARFEVIESPYRGTFFGVIGLGQTIVAFGLHGSAYMSGDRGKSWKIMESGLTTSIVAGALTQDGSLVLATQGGNLLTCRVGETRLVPVQLQRPMAYAGVVSAGPRSVALTGLLGVRVERVPE